ncbi:MAG: radical SAM protein [Planctomycetia bacterium]|nr:radical SAM protein [Candidatus Brocadia sp.]QOJ07755.1 MAG: radical SAM protein [Planctomycetia bacterium]TVL98359.1 MAG: hypothetical protein CV082_01130 [Candidatus Brocadia sp. BL1]HQU30356.1 radical SAM protein [Candidatus Brocadia sapporoensis]
MQTNVFPIKPHDCLKSSQEIRRWYDENYHLLSRAGLWLKGEEPNTMESALFYQAELRFLVCRLSTYRDVSVSISHPLVAQIAQEVKGAFTDFAFLPPPKDLGIMTAAHIPLWSGTTTKEPPCAFDVLGISNSFVLELLNLPKLLHFSGIPLFKNERMMRQDIPFIVLGGASSAVTSVLHGPTKEQGFGDHCGLVDAVFIGEGEYSIKQFLEIVKKGKSAGLRKADILRACHGKVDGFYEPDKYEHRYEMTIQSRPEMWVGTGKTQGGLIEISPKEPYVSYPVKSATVYDLDPVRTLESGPIWYETESIGTGSLQISNGCPCFCSFCAESWEKKPYRERSLSKLLEALKAAKAQQGLDTVNLFSFNFNTHTELYPMILSFYREMGSVSLKSQRFDLLSADRFLVEVQQIIGKTTVSCGMEGISERLRRYLHKNLTEEQIYKACEFLFEKGIRELKIFLICTGLEQSEDFSEFARFAKRLDDLKRMMDSNVRMIFSLTPLYYPPHTPLQFHECLTAIEDKKKIGREVERICKFHGMEFRESASYEEIWLTQLLAMGDRRLTPALIRSSITEGFVYYHAVSKELLRNWRIYLTDLGLAEENYFCAKGKEYVFPWDDIDPGVSKKFLWEEYGRSIHFDEREYCLGRPRIEAQCLGCGACPTPAHIRKLIHHTVNQPFLKEEILRIAERKRNKLVLRVVVEIESSLRLVPKRFVGVAAARALMLAIPEVIPYYQSLSAHMRNFAEEAAFADFTHGINVYHLVFLSEDKSKDLLKGEFLSLRANHIQKYCRGFRIREFVSDSGDMPDVHGILYKVRFAKEFTESFLRQKLGEYLHANYVRHTLLKRGGQTVFKVDTKHKKNAVVFYASICKANQREEPVTEFTLFMMVSKRFHMQEFLEACYGFERRKEIVCTQIETLGYYRKNQHGARCAVCNESISEALLFGQPFGENQCLMCSIDRGKISC